MHARLYQRLGRRLFHGWRVGLIVAVGFLGSVEAQNPPAERPPRRGMPAVTLETIAFRCRLAADAGSFEVLDKRAKTVWKSDPLERRLGSVTLLAGTREVSADLSNGSVTRTSPTSLVALYHPLPSQPEAGLRVTWMAGKDVRTLEVAYEADPALNVVNIRLLDDAMGVADEDHGYVVVPVREGILVPADSRLAFTNVFDTYTYEGCHMAMAGMVKNGAALLLTWDDPYTAFELKSVLSATVPAAPQTLLSSLVLRQSSRGYQLHFLGGGDYLAIGSTYREIARKKGWLVPWEEKLKEHPQDEKLLGAVNFKLWNTLERQMNEESTREESAKVNWTFDEAAQIAEHLKKDLQLDRVLFMIGGWIRRGYDNQHPDILPAAPECGGNEGLAACARRVQELGYLFCLHDNYQDIYRDSPSWNEDLIMKGRDGSLAKGGKWAGGRAYLTCSRQALELARRPGNLEAVKKLTGAKAYFIDTTYAAGLQECFDPKHPSTRLDDMKYKQGLSDYARGVFGIFGSECGREWAIPHCDFFEGFTGVSGRSYHDAALPGKLGGAVIPLFEIVYRDTVAMYGKYGYDIMRSADYVLSQMALGRTLNYHSVPAHLYWRRADGGRDEPAPAGSGADQAVFTRADRGWAEGLHPLDRFIKNTYEVLSPLNESTAQMRVTGHAFLTPDRKVQRTVFAQGRKKVMVTVNAGAADHRCDSSLGGRVVLPPCGFLVESPEWVAFYALSWREIQYTNGALFTLRSLDNQALARSDKVRVYHGFGDPRLRLPRGEVTVPREAVVSGRDLEKP